MPVRTLLLESKGFCHLPFKNEQMRLGSPPQWPWDFLGNKEKWQRGKWPRGRDEETKPQVCSTSVTLWLLSSWRRRLTAVVRISPLPVSCHGKKRRGCWEVGWLEGTVCSDWSRRRRYQQGLVTLIWHGGRRKNDKECCALAGLQHWQSSKGGRELPQYLFWETDSNILLMWAEHGEGEVAKNTSVKGC